MKLQHCPQQSDASWQKGAGHLVEEGNGGAEAGKQRRGKRDTVLCTRTLESVATNLNA